MDSFGAPQLAAYTAIALVFDRHEWLEEISDNLDIVY
jgi:hypothetical protein